MLGVPVHAWAHEIKVWVDLTTGNYHGVDVGPARTGIEAASHNSVAIPALSARSQGLGADGGPRQTEVAFDKGRRLLEAMPYPDNLDHRFVVDPRSGTST